MLLLLLLLLLVNKDARASPKRSVDEACVLFVERGVRDSVVCAMECGVSGKV